MPITPKASLVGIHLKWDDQNGFEDGFRIYRSPYPFDEENLPAVLVELPPDTTEYIDEDVVIGVEYFYRISTFYGAHEVFASNQFSALAKPGPDTIGEYYQGGYYIGNIEIPDGTEEGTYAVIMTGRDAEPETTLKWKDPRSDTPGTGSRTDGMANTLAMINNNIDIHDAARYCYELEHEGFSDFYLPSIDELNLAFNNRALLGDAQFRSEYYWSSTQRDGNSAFLRNLTSGSENNYLKSNTYRVRPVRRLKLMI